MFSTVTTCWRQKNPLPPTNSQSTTLERSTEDHGIIATLSIRDKPRATMHTTEMNQIFDLPVYGNAGSPSLSRYHSHRGMALKVRGSELIDCTRWIPDHGLLQRKKGARNSVRYL
eukprot:Nitzschia sp. Nitz4//scaffold1_size375055//284358//284801//NITZ4_000309-RA/size375055-snap-gene-0.215-mRNA-1//1//CDS//3329541144//8573//frame0